MWNVRSAGFWGTPNTNRSDSISIWVSLSRIYITNPAWQQWSAVVTILEKASHPPRSSYRGENHFRHQVEGARVAMAPGKGAALDLTVRATLSLILITSSYAVAESKCSILFSTKFEIYANLRIMKFDLGKVTFFENWNRFTKWKVNCVQDSCPFSAIKDTEREHEWELFSSIFTFCFIAAARSSAETFFSESRHPQYAEQRGTKKTVSRQTMQYGDEPPSRHQKRSGAASSQRQFRNSQQASGFQYKDSNLFEFSSDWNHTDSGFYGSVDIESVTEMTDAKLQELGFPVQTQTNPDPIFHKSSSSSSSERQKVPAPSVIDKHSQFFQLMSRKYQLRHSSQCLTLYHYEKSKDF